MAASYSAVDALFECFVRDGGAPGIAFGVTLGGRLVHSGAFGSVCAEAPAAAPNADSVFRVASMTKSFTAAAVLLLRDRGALSLDADIKTYLPEFNASGAPDGAPPLTLRLLLSMNAGLATDDPWGDRQEDIDAAAFGEMLARGFSYIHAPGTRYEVHMTLQRSSLLSLACIHCFGMIFVSKYSNLSYRYSIAGCESDMAHRSTLH